MNTIFRGFPAGVSLKNAVMVSPADSLADKYNWLKSSSRDGAMGALSTTNRRTLILTPGTYTLTAKWTLDTEYVNIAGLDGIAESVMITGSLADSTLIEQTADNIVLSGFSVKNTSTAEGGLISGLRINCASGNDNCKYYNLRALALDTDANIVPIFGDTDIGGKWYYCYGEGRSWVLASGKYLSATMYFCEGGDYSFGGDGWYTGTGDVYISGTFHNCVGGNYSFGGCGSVGCDITSAARLYNCKAGHHSFAMGKTFAGEAYNCEGGTCCFGGTFVTPDFGKVTGKLVNCVASGNNSFGMGSASCELTGQLINCYDRGTSAHLTTATGGLACATLTVITTGANNDLKFTAREPGTTGHNIKIQYAVVAKGSATLTTTWDDATGIVTFRLNYSSGVTTANDAITVFRADALFNSLVSVEVAEGDGSGTIGEVFAATALSGGVDVVRLINNHSGYPITCTDNFNLEAFDSGRTYTNSGAAAAVTLALPPAIPGLRYRFSVQAAQELRIDPDGTETIALANGVQQAAGLYITANAAGEGCVLECVIEGQWEHFDSIGTWTVEA